MSLIVFTLKPYLILCLHGFLQPLLSVWSNVYLKYYFTVQQCIKTIQILNYVIIKSSLNY